PKPQVLGVDRRFRVVSVLKVKTTWRSRLLTSSYADPPIALKVSSIGSSGILCYFGSEINSVVTKFVLGVAVDLKWLYERM
nr:hypothetical protein [Tanacetum cinerariifolium]